MLTFLAVAGYGMMMGVYAQIIKYRSGEGENWDWIDHPEIMASIIWPVLVPALLGMAIAKPFAPTGPTRLEKKQAKEIAAAEHKAKVIAIEAKAVRDMERMNGIGAK